MLPGYFVLRCRAQCNPRLVRRSYAWNTLYVSFGSKKCKCVLSHDIREHTTFSLVRLEFYAVPAAGQFYELLYINRKGSLVGGHFCTLHKSPTRGPLLAGTVCKRVEDNKVAKRRPGSLLKENPLTLKRTACRELHEASFFDREGSLPKAIAVYGPGVGPPAPVPWKEDSWRAGFKPPGTTQVLQDIFMCLNTPA